MASETTTANPELLQTQVAQLLVQPPLPRGLAETREENSHSRGSLSGGQVAGHTTRRHTADGDTRRLRLRPALADRQRQQQQQPLQPVPEGDLPADSGHRPHTTTPLAHRHTRRGHADATQARR